MKHMLLSLLTILIVVSAGCAHETRVTDGDEADHRDFSQEPVRPVEPSPIMLEPFPQQGPEAGAVAERQVPGRTQSAETGVRLVRAPAARPHSWVPPSHSGRDIYAGYDDNPVRKTDAHPVSTFSIDVDTGSYSNVRRFLTSGRLPPADAVRAEELINYFDYGYAQPDADAAPFSVTTEIAPAPWNSQRHLLLVGLQGKRVSHEDIPAVNLVYLVDTSGSMHGADRIDLLKYGFALMARQLRAQDRVAIVSYAGSAGLVLESTPGDRTGEILAALDRLRTGGPTNGGAGIQLAYEVARENYIEGGVNRVILASDGDFNVGVTGVESLKSLVADRRRSGVGLTVLGFGGGNYNDHLAEQLANNGNGSYHYIDTPAEARKVLVDQLAATMLTIAQDVKIQIEFNPTQVESYRLIGYENRVLSREDFSDDRVDAGEIGAGHSVTALYELTLVGAASDGLRPGLPTPFANGDRDDGELAQLRLRYKYPGQERSLLLERSIESRAIVDSAGPRLRFAAAVAGFADALRGGHHLEGWDMDDIAALAGSARSIDRDGYQGEFIGLVERAHALAQRQAQVEIGG